MEGNPDEVERYILSAPKPKYKQTKLSFVSLLARSLISCIQIEEESSRNQWLQAEQHI